MVCFREKNDFMGFKYLLSSFSPQWLTFNYILSLPAWAYVWTMEAESLSTDSQVTCALGLAQSGTIWHLSDIAFVPSVRKCLPTRQPCLSWAQVSQPLVHYWIGQVSAQSLGIYAAFTAAKASQHCLPGTTLDHLALWLLLSLSMSYWERRQTA